MIALEVALRSSMSASEAIPVQAMPVWSRRKSRDSSSASLPAFRISQLRTVPSEQEVGWTQRLRLTEWLFNLKLVILCHTVPYYSKKPLHCSSTKHMP